MTRKVKPRIACPHCGSVYVLEKPGEGESQAEAEAEAAAAAEAERDQEITRYSKPFWALFWRCVERGTDPDPLLAMFRINATRRFRPEQCPSEAELGRLVLVPAQGETFAAWREHVVSLWPALRYRYPAPEVAEWAWVPGDAPGQATSVEDEIFEEGAA